MDKPMTQTIGKWEIKVVKVFDRYGYICINTALHAVSRNKVRNMRCSELTYDTPGIAMREAEDRVFSWI